MKRWLLLAFGLLGVSVAACGSMVAYKSTRVAASEDPDKLYAATVRVFLRRGWGFQARDPDAQAVETDWVEQEGFYGAAGAKVWLSYRVLFTTTAAPAKYR
ncbi:MAG: hypothetical protein MJE77_37000 [Proteobacteria bacterium]|nr:hypothetical protein [Pseudomonadota bacterium]